MRRYPVLVAVLLLLLSAAAVHSVKIGYHGIDAALISGPIDLSPAQAAPDNGSFGPASHIAVPFIDHNGGKGAVGVITAGNTSLTCLIYGFDNGSAIPRELFWDTDADGDGVPDLVITDMSGRIYLLGSDFPEAVVQLSPDDAVLKDKNGTLDLADVSGDGIADLLVLEDGGSRLRVVQGPLDGPSGSFELELPFDCSVLDPGPDLTGDGLPELVLSGDDGVNSTLIVYDGASLTLIASLPIPGRVSCMDHGDLNGDGTDDMLLLLPGTPPEGSMMVLLGNGIRGTTLDPAYDWSIEGEPTAPIHDGMMLSFIDLDGDMASDIIVGDPSWDGGRGRVSLFYGGSEMDLSTDRRYAFPDADILGSAPDSGCGGLLISSLDHDGDMLPDIFFNNGPQLLRWALPANSPPDQPLVLRFVEPGTDTTMERAQIGESIGIRLVATGGGVSYPDIVRVLVRSKGVSGTSSWMLLKETGADTSLYTGMVRLLDGTMPGRSISVNQGDILTLSMGDVVSGQLLVMGRTGQDDPPYIGPPEANITAIEGTPFSLELHAYDPEDDPIEWSVKGLPSWMEHEEGLLSGTPGDIDVGTYDITVNVTANGKNGSLEFSISVLNLPPVLQPISVPSSVMESEVYSGSFRTDGTLSALTFSGPVDRSWLVMFPNGTLSGIPRNADVGTWQFKTTAYDLQAVNISYEWSVIVENALPVIEVPFIGPVKEGSTLLMDLNETNEGDGSTLYFLVGAPEGMALNRTSGVISYIVPYGSDSISFRAGVTDGHGGSDRVDVEIEVIPSAPVLLTELPFVLKAGEVLHIDLASTGEGSTDIVYSLDRELPFLHPGSTFSTSGTFSMRPWNVDIGRYVLNISIGTNAPSLTVHRWEITVVGNDSFTDPSILLSTMGQKGSSLSLRVLGTNGSLPLKGARLMVIGTSDKQVIRTLDLQGLLGSTIVLDVSGLNGSFVITAEMELLDTEDGNRTLNSSIKIELSKGEGDQNGLSWVILVIFIAMISIILLVLLGVLLSIERTSYNLQSFFASGSSKNDEVILSLIQRRPGVRFRELLNEIAMDRRDLVSGLLSLSSSGHIRAVPDGTRLRFLPTVGSFVRGPLALDRSQGMLLDLLKGGAELTVTELSEKSGLSIRSVNKELSLLALKDAVSTKGKGSDRRFYLDRRQRARLSSWARSGKL